MGIRSDGSSSKDKKLRYKKIKRAEQEGSLWIRGHGDEAFDKIWNAKEGRD